MYLVEKGGRPYRALPSLLDIVLVGTFEDIETAIGHQCLQVFIANDFMKFKGLVHQIFSSDFNAHT